MILYKKCPKLLRRLWVLLRVVLWKGTVPAQAGGRQKDVWSLNKDTRRILGIWTISPFPYMLNENFLFHIGKETDNLYLEWVPWLISKEGRDSRILPLSRTCKCTDPATPWSENQQQESNSCVARSSLFIWVNPQTAYQCCTAALSRPRPSQQTPERDYHKPQPYLWSSS